MVNLGDALVYAVCTVLPDMIVSCKTCSAIPNAVSRLIRLKSLSPRAGSANPYSTPVDRPQALSVDGPQRVPQAQTTLHTH
eukprot:4166145-Amphidinium_carterae.1